MIALVRLAGQRDGVLCPNYLISTRALALPTIRFTALTNGRRWCRLPVCPSTMSCAQPTVGQRSPANAARRTGKLPYTERRALSTQLAEAVLATPIG
ncbi:hypothetical protein HC891_27125, partial [Candidatus Gracilibacteria bacterium]|nr:hypothetical protein [Candidatus Gracilibacteria bacterium]